jgi:hypothetical protein
MSDPDDPISCSAFTIEVNLDAKRSKKRLCPTQVAGKDARIFGPASVVACPHGALANPQKIGGAPRPGAALAHELPQASSDWVRVDDALDCRPAICRVRASERTGRPQRWFAGPRPDLEVSHPGQPADVNGIHGS